MRIAVFNLKGGVGKTVISLNLALTMNFPIVTNEPYGQMERILPKGDLFRLDPDESVDFDENEKVIFDLGGYVDPKVAEILTHADWVVIPIVNGTEDEIQVSINTIMEVRNLNENILIVVNRAAKKDKEKIHEILYESRIRYPTLEVKESKAFKHLYKRKVSIKNMLKVGGIYGFHFRPVAEQFDKIIRFINRRR